MTHVVVVTGLSGAGKSTALGALEDLGFHAIENLPPTVISAAITACEAAGIADVALGLGATVGPFLEEASQALSGIVRGEGRKLTVLFLDASDDVVTRRFSETRRPHPLLAEGRLVGEPSVDLADVRSAVSLERERLAPLLALATMVLDTSGLRAHDLRKRVFAVIRPGTLGATRMSTRLVSFGFKFGLPGDADVVLDVRFLDNPFFVPELRDLTGMDDAVREFVLSAPDAGAFIEKSADLLGFLLPRFEREGKSYLTVAIGCTGGQHRSVAVAAELGRRLSKTVMPGLVVVHRDARARPASRRPPEGGAKE